MKKNWSDPGWSGFARETPWRKRIYSGILKTGRTGCRNIGIPWIRKPDLRR
jgi:hypothetical protein